jgi:ABC-type Fe3+ transport system permease subunit
VGAVVLAAAIPLALAGIGARFYMRIVSDSDTEYIQREFLEIGQGLAWIAIRNGLAFTVLGAVFLVVGVVCAMWADRREAPRYPAVRPGTR